MAQAFTEDEITDFLAQLDSFRAGLAPRQQRILDSLMEAAAGADLDGRSEVEGFVHHVERDLSVERRKIAQVLRRASVRDEGATR